MASHISHVLILSENRELELGFDYMTVLGHDTVMKRVSETKVNTATLKARLAEFLRKVRAGSELVILDRHTPIARLIPFGETSGLQVYKAIRPFQEVRQIRGIAAQLGDSGSLGLLQEERGTR